MIVTVFRSRLKPGVRDEYVTLVDQMEKLARTMLGYISHKGFFADDGERVTIVEFEHEEGLRAWRPTPSISPRKSWRGRSTTPRITFRFARSTANRSSMPRRPRNARPRRRGLDPNEARRH
jgi:antibiotic biosynthesis monooxygenase (ABM) superfamily enzyme